MTQKLKLAELELRKQKAANLDRALEYLEGRMDNEKLMRVYAILTEGLERTASGRSATVWEAV